jgi:hypothetical protein
LIGVGTVTMKKLASLIDRRRHRHDEEIGFLQRLGIRREADIFCGGEFLLGDLAGAVLAGAQFIDAAGIDIEAEHRKIPGHVDGERQADISEPNNPDPDVLKAHQSH